MDLSKKTPEYLEQKNMVMLILYNVFAFLLSITFAIQPISATSKVIYFSVSGSLLGAGILVILLIALLYKNKTVIHFKKKYNLVNKVFSYVYLAIFAGVVIVFFLIRKKTVDTESVKLLNIILWVLSGLLSVEALASIGFNSFVLVKEKLPENLAYYQNLENGENNQINDTKATYDAATETPTTQGKVVEPKEESQE